jgi:hypothetical protein
MGLASHFKKTALMCTTLFLFITGAFAQPRIGEKMPEFRLQATDQNFYGIQDGDNKVSVLFFMGHT